MKCIVLFGAGKSSSVLIQYLKDNSAPYNWQVFVADASLETAAAKTGTHSHVTPVGIDVYDEEQRASLVQKADVVISLLPPGLHILVAKDCIQFSKHLLTASYIDEHIKVLESDIQSKGLLFLCEMGLDPGIDHMSAMQMIHGIQSKGGVITSFKSHCGGLVAPESDDNPWHYKISWNPRNVVMAGKAGAVYKENGSIVSKEYTDLFSLTTEPVVVPEVGLYAWYPNRDSLQYMKLYQLENAGTFLRTTLRHPDFIIGWQNIITLKLTDESIFYNTDNLSVAEFFMEHYEAVSFETWRTETLDKDIDTAAKISEQVSKIHEAEEKLSADGLLIPDEDIVAVNKEGKLVTMNYKADKEKVILLMNYLNHKAILSLEQLAYLGIEDEDTFINKGVCSITDIMQFILEKKLALQENDKDMVVMLHEIEYSLDNELKKQSSYLVLQGENNIQTAMAKTVGLPLGIAAKLLLEGKLEITGLHIPVIPGIYNPVLDELRLHGIAFKEC